MRVLVIKLGALGDFVQAFAAFQQIRQVHAQDEVTLLTTPPYAELARASGLFDRIETDGRPKGLKATLGLFGRRGAARYRRVYDLQTSSRSRLYFYAFLPFAPQWSGIPAGRLASARPAPTGTVCTISTAWPISCTWRARAPPMSPGERCPPDLSWAATVAGGRAGDR